MNNRLINTKVAGGGGGCTDIVDNYDPFGGNGVALYQLNGDATDESGNYNGSVTGTLTYEAGVFGQAANFSSNDAAITANTFISSSTDTQDFSISMWFKHDGFTTPTFKSLIGANGSASQGVIRVLVRYVSSNTYTIDFARGYNSTYYSYELTPSITLLNSSWYNLVVTFNSSLKKVEYYLNGSFISYANILNTTSSISISNQIVFGQYLNSGAYPTYSWGGLMDQVRIFNTALTPLEVEALYTEELCVCDGTVDTLDILGDGSCIATYQLDGNANDLSGNYSGTPTDVFYGVGEFDLAGVFNGSSSYVQTTYNQNTTNAFAWSLWVNPTAIGSLPMIIGEQDNFSPYNGVALGLSASEFYLMITGTNTGRPSFGTPIVGSWQHIVVSYDGAGNWELYQNNVKTTASYTATNGSNNLRLGNVGVTGWNSFNGSIDQVRIFNKALSTGEVTTLYNETSCTVTYSNTEWGGAWDTVNSITSACTGGSSTLSFSNSNRTATESGTGFYVSAFSENQYGTFYLFGADAGGATTKFTGNFTDDTFIYRPILEEGVYAEILMEAPDLRLGITKNRVCSAPDQSAWYDNAIVYRNYNGQILRYNTVVTTTATFTVGDIIGILLDETAGIVTFYKNGAFIYTVNL